MSKVFPYLLSTIFFFTVFFGAICTIDVSAVSSDIVVAKDGTGKFTTVQAAIDSIPANNSKQVVVFIKNGTYKEVVTIKKNNIYIIGESNTKTILTYDNYAGKLKSDGTIYGTSNSGSFYVYGKDIILENLTIENTFDENINTDGKQAVAAYINGDRNIVRNCILIGNQDTLYSNAGRQYYTKCKIIGDTDFIFGGATAVFDDCDIVSTVRGGYVTAASTDISSYGYLFLNCRLTSSAPANSTYLGRPWRKDAYVVYKTCYLGSHIKDIGWTTMSGNLPENARFFEYKNTGPGAVVNSSRRQLSDTQAKEFTIDNLLKGSDNWQPAVAPVIKSAFTTLEAENYDSTNSTTVQKIGNASGSSVGYIENGNYLAFKKIDFGTGSKSFKALVATAGTPNIELRINSPTGTLIGTLPVPLTGGFNAYKEQSCNITGVTGVNDLYLVFTGSVNIDSFTFSNTSIIPTVLSGDVNGDGKIDVVDATMLKSVVLKKNAESIFKNKPAADMNNDSIINSIDYLLLKKEIQKV